MTLWRLLSAISSMIGARVAGAVFGLLTQFILARTFSPAEVGTVLLAMSIAAFASLIATCGYPALAVTTLARYQTLGRQRLVEGFFAAARHDSLVVSGALIALVAVLIFALPFDPQRWQALIYGCLAAPAYAVMRLNNSAANSLRRFTLSYVPDFVFRAMLLFAFIAVMTLIMPGFDITWVLWAFVAVMWGVAAAQAWLLGPQGAAASWSITAPHRLGVHYRGRAGALVVVALVTIAFADIVTLVGGLFLQPDDVAVLGISVRLAALTGFITQASQMLVMRDLTAAIARGSQAEINALLHRTNILSLAVMLAAIAGGIVLGGYALSLFGASYRAGHWPLVIFLVSQTLRAAGGMNGHLLSLHGHQMRMASACLGSLCAMIAAAALLAPQYGVTGIALAVVLGDAIWTVWIAVLAQSLTGRRGDIAAVLARMRPGVRSGNRHNLA